MILRLLLLSMLLAASVLAQSTPFFKRISPYPVAYSLPSALAFASSGDVIVAVGENVMLYSDNDGASWHDATTDLVSGWFPANFDSVVFHNGTFVAVAAKQTALSLDGRTWKINPLPGPGLSEPLMFSKVVGGNGKFVMTGLGHYGDHATYVSTNGSVWQEVPIDLEQTLAFAAGAFWTLRSPATPGSTTLVRSTDGFHWEELPASVPAWSDPACTANCIPLTNCAAVAFNDGKYFAHLYGAASTFEHHVLISSVDGLTWAFDRVLLQTYPYPDIWWDDLAVVNGNLIFEEKARGNIITYGLKNYVQFGPQSHKILLSPDLNKWTNSTTPLEFLSGVAFGNGTIVAVGGMFHGVGVGPFQPVILASTDSGDSLKSVPLPGGTSGLASVRFADQRFIAVGGNGTVLRSFDGTNWVKRLSNTSSHLLDVTYGGGLWVAVGANGKIAASTDGSFFSLRFSGTEIQLNGIAYGDGKFVAVGQTGAIATSPDSSNWTVIGTDEAQDLWSVAYGNGRFVAAGTNGIVHVSTNGVSWQSTRIQTAKLLTRIAFGKDVFIAADFRTSACYVSADGLSWQRVLLSAAYLYGADFSGESLWLSGDLSSIWESPSFKIAGKMDSSSRFTVRIPPAGAGTYRLLSTPAFAPPNWTPSATFSNLFSEIFWTDSYPIAPSRFYQLQRIE